MTTTFRSKVLDRMIQVVREAGLDPVDDAGSVYGRGRLSAMDDDFNTIATASYSLGFSRSQLQLAKYPIIPGSDSIQIFNFYNNDGEEIRAMLDRWREFVNTKQENH